MSDIKSPSLPTPGQTSEEPKKLKGVAALKADKEAVENENTQLKKQIARMEAQATPDEGIQPVDQVPAPVQNLQTEPEADLKGGRNPKATAAPLGLGKRLDATKYNMKYPDKKLMWINDTNGDVQRWIDVGADPVPVLENASRTFEGITDRHESKYVRAIGGDDGMGGHHWVYLLMMEPELYDHVKVEPLRQRQKAIQEALHRGRDQSEGAGGELQAYAPHLPTGGKGFQTIQDHLTGR